MKWFAVSNMASNSNYVWPNLTLPLLNYVIITMIRMGENPECYINYSAIIMLDIE